MSQRRDPYMAFNFVIEIDGLIVGGFTEVSGLESQIEVESYREGGVNDYVHQLPGPTTYSPLVLTHGLTDSSALWDWYYKVTLGTFERKNGTIMLKDSQQSSVMSWDFRNAYPVKWTGPKFKADSDEVAFESLELVHEGLKFKKG